MASSTKLDGIRQRLELAEHLPDTFNRGNSAADRWREDVTTLLTEIEQLRVALREIYGHATADSDGQPCCDTVVMLAKAALYRLGLDG